MHAGLQRRLNPSFPPPITWIAPKFGVGNAIFFVLAGQLLSAALIEHFALFGARHLPLTLPRATGIALMMAGVLLTQKV